MGFEERGITFVFKDGGRFASEQTLRSMGNERR